MTQEDKQLLLKDLCARLPYGVIVNISHVYHSELKAYIKAINSEREMIYYEICGSSSPLFERNILGIKQYLRPLSSMTEEEKKKYNDIVKNTIDFYDCAKSEEVSFFITPIDYLNSIHVDYRGLIPKGLAIEVTKENNPYEDINL